MKVLLVQPYTFTVRGLPQVPLALMFVGAAAEKRGDTVRILDLNFETNGRRILDDFKPDVVGITCLTGRMIFDSIRISQYVRRSFPKAKIVWGGVHVSVLPENTLVEDFIDYVVVGEGEETFVDLLDAIEKGRDPATVPGIGYKDGNRVVMNDRRPLISNIDAVSLTPWHMINPKRYLKHETLLLTSRGCPHRCAFCYNEKFNFRKWRGMSPERVRAEIDHALSFHPIRRFRFDDDNFCVNKRRFHAILDFLPKDIPLYFESRIEYIDDEFCRHLTEFKDAFVFVGLESGSNERLKKMQKDLTVEQIRHGYELINRYRIKTSGSFVIGSPGETREELQQTLRLIDELKPTRPSCCIFVPLPGSIFTEQLIREGKLADFQHLADWGRFTDAERSGRHQYGEATPEELNRIYSKYWWKFVWAFALNLRLGWIFLGFWNLLSNYRRRLLKRIHRDL